MRKVVEYKLLTSSRADELSKEINIYIKDGWEVYGEVQSRTGRHSDYGTWGQVVVKYETVTEAAPEPEESNEEEMSLAVEFEALKQEMEELREWQLAHDKKSSNKPSVKPPSPPPAPVPRMRGKISVF